MKQDTFKLLELLISRQVKYLPSDLYSVNDGRVLEIGPSITVFIWLGLLSFSTIVTLNILKVGILALNLWGRQSVSPISLPNMCMPLWRHVPSPAASKRLRMEPNALQSFANNSTSFLSMEESLEQLIISWHCILPWKNLATVFWSSVTYPLFLAPLDSH